MSESFLILTINVPTGGGEFTIPLQNINVTDIDWGDGNTNQYNSPETDKYTHLYSSADKQIYTITVNVSRTEGSTNGSLKQDLNIVANGWINPQYLTSVTQWYQEKNHIVDFTGAFKGCSSLTSVPDSLPSSGQLQNLDGMFYGATIFDSPNIIHWNTGNITNTNAMFHGATLFNQPIGNWNLSNVTNTSNMFYGATSFNQPIGNWNLRQVLNATDMFSGATSFNNGDVNDGIGSINNLQLPDNIKIDTIVQGATNFNFGYPTFVNTDMQTNIDTSETLVMNGNYLYIGQNAGSTIKRYDLTTNVITDISNHRFNSPAVLAINNADSILYVANNSNNVISKYEIRSEAVSEFITIDGTRNANAMAYYDNFLYVLNNNQINRINVNNTNVNTPKWADFANVQSFAINGDTMIVLINNTPHFEIYTINLSVVNPTSQLIPLKVDLSKIFGIFNPTLIAFNNNNIYVAYNGNIANSGSVIQINILSTERVIYGLNSPRALLIDGQSLYISSNANAIKKITLPYLDFRSEPMLKLTINVPAHAAADGGKFTIPLKNINVTDIDWGDGNITNYSILTYTGKYTYSYKNQTAQTYNITVNVSSENGQNGSLTGGDWSNPQYLTSVTQWDQEINHIVDFTSAFNNCINLTSVPYLLPVQTKNLDGMFANATNFNSPNIIKWNMSNVLNISNMFINAINFNQPIGSWGLSTSNVVYTNNMFEGATSFNQDIGSWYVQNVERAQFMFFNASAFNNGGNPSIADWFKEGEKDITFDKMFAGAISFNQPIGNWHTENISSLKEMFLNATSFNQSIGGWNLLKVLNTSDAANMFNGATNFNNGGVSSGPQAINNLQLSNDVKIDTLVQGAPKFNFGVPTFDNILLQSNIVGNPETLAINGNYLYIGQNTETAIRRYDLKTAKITSITPAYGDPFNRPSILAIDNTNNILYVTNNNNTKISQYNLQTGENKNIDHIIFDDPITALVYYNDSLYALNNQQIDQINVQTYERMTKWANVQSLTINGNIMYILSNTTENSGTIVLIDLLEEKVRNFTLNEVYGLVKPIAIAVSNNNLYVVYNGDISFSGSVIQINLTTNVTTRVIYGLNSPKFVFTDGKYLCISNNSESVTIITLPTNTDNNAGNNNIITTQSYLIGQPLPSRLNRSILSGRGAMPVKSSTSDGTNSFSMDRRNYQRTLDPNPATNTINPNIRSLSQNPFGMFGGQQRMFFSQSKKQNTIAGEGPRYQAQKKWMGGSGGRDASQIAAKRRVNSIGNGSLNSSNGQLAFMSRFNPNTNREALIHIRDQGPSVQTKVRGRNLRTGMSVIS